MPFAAVLAYPSRVTGSSIASNRDRVGLCATCTHSRKIQSDRGSVFFLCKLSETDPAFPKYPRLPVLSCSGYTPAP
jgi:hypothetical protein